MSMTVGAIWFVISLPDSMTEGMIVIVCGISVADWCDPGAGKGHVDEMIVGPVALAVTESIVMCDRVWCSCSNENGLFW